MMKRTKDKESLQVLELNDLNKRYKVVQQIGKGAYSEVLKCQNSITNEIVALKKIRILDPKNGFPQNSIREVSILRSIDHENIIKLREIITEKKLDGPVVYFVFDFCEYDLYRILDYSLRDSFTEYHIASYSYQLLKAMLELKRINIIHRDLKPLNIFVTYDNIIKLGDFGLSKALIRNKENTSEVVTLLYRPPELIMGCRRYAFEVDMWSFGCTLYEMVTRKPMFLCLHPNKELEHLNMIFSICGSPNELDWPEVTEYSIFKTLKHKPSRLRTYLTENLPKGSEMLINLLENIFVLNPKKRITVEDAIEHPFFKQYENELHPSKLQNLQLSDKRQRETIKALIQKISGMI